MHAIRQDHPAMLVMEERGVDILGRHPEWVLTPDGLAGLMLPAQREDAGTLPADTQRISISMQFRDGCEWIQILCLDRSLETVFLRFCQSVLAEVRSGREVTAALRKSLENYRRLFIKEQSQVAPEKIAGLMVELRVLLWLLENDLPAVPSWLGPSGGTHDFVFEGVHLEVKALPASGEKRVRIASLHQLVEPDHCALYLLGAALSPGGENIGMLFERVLAATPPEHVEQLEQAMGLVGCSLPVPEEWNARSFSCGDIEAWVVNEEFPRIIPSMLPQGKPPEGVSEVMYRVSLDMAVHNRVDPKMVLQKIFAVVD